MTFHLLQINTFQTHGHILWFQTKQIMLYFQTSLNCYVNICAKTFNVVLNYSLSCCIVKIYLFMKYSHILNSILTYGPLRMLL